MKAIVIDEGRNLVWHDVPDPVCHDEFDVKIAVKACALNRADVMQRAGTYAPPPEWPTWPGLECAGVVVEAPAGGRFKPGDAVCALLGGGGYAEQVVVPEGMCMPLPKGFSFEQAAAVPEVYATAYLNLKIVGEIQRGETFFINGGEGGLGIAAIQLAKHVFGAKVVAQVASDENGEFCRSVGADVVSNRFTGDLVATLAANPPNVAIDPVGGPLMGKCIATMPYRGRWISLASMAGPETTLDVNLLWRKNLRVIGSTLRSRTSAEKAQILGGLVRDVWPAFEGGVFAPFIHKVLPVTEAAEAHRIMEAGENRGKIVMAMSKWICAGICAAVVSLQAATVERTFRPERHSRGDTNVRVQQPVDEASWIWAKGSDVWGGAVFSETRTTPDVLAKMPQAFFRFRRDFAAADEALELDVSADERFVLLLDGEEIARGPMRGLPNRWNYQTYRVTGLEPGTHRLEAVCWQVGEHAPLAQVSIRGGFIVKASGAYDSQLSTGKAEWKVAPLAGTRMTHKGKSGAFGVGSQCEVRGTGLLDEEPGAGAWSDAVVVRGPVKTWAGLTVQGWKLFPSSLRDMMHVRKTPGAVKRGFDALRAGAVVPARSRATAWWDLGDYYCAYPCLSVSGGKGARVSWDWAECLTGPDGKKGDRAAFEGLDMPRPFGDVFICDGRANARFTTPWWRCGRWCRLTVETADEPLALDKVEIAETRYPVELAASFECDDAFVMKMQPVCARSLQMCMHEMFFDCPYYEQQMYPGDSRLQYLVSGFFDTEDRIVRNAINLYDADRRENGQISMNCPTRGTQEALGFTCCEAMMFGDYAWNHANRAWLKAKLPGLNHTLMGMDEFARDDGLLRKTPGWNFVDWVAPPWKYGVPPDGDSENPNAEMNLQYLHAMLSAAIAEDAAGDAALSAYWRGRAERLKAAVKSAFWCEEKSLFASNIAKTEFSEHSQCLALLADVVSGEEAERCFKALVETPDLARGTIYYKHYLFSMYFKFRRPDLFFGNLGFWRDCLDWNLSTILETPNTNSRSDCHGWGSHPLWHLHTGVAGVKSAAPFYEKVLVEPQPAHLKRIRSSTPTPKGEVKLDLSFGGGRATGTVVLPEGLAGAFRWNGSDVSLNPGVNTLD